MEVFLSDFGQRYRRRYRQQLEAEGIEWEQGQHTLERILSADEGREKSRHTAYRTPTRQESYSRKRDTGNFGDRDGKPLHRRQNVVCITG